MTVSEHVKSVMGRWTADRYERCVPPIPDQRPVGERAVAPFESVDDGTGTWIPAGLVEVHDEVNVGGVWLTVTGTAKTRADFDQSGSVVLYFDGREEPTDFLAMVYARDEAAIIGAQIRGGAR